MNRRDRRHQWVQAADFVRLRFATAEACLPSQKTGDRRDVPFNPQEPAPISNC
jgi:hypothetical protein